MPTQPPQPLPPLQPPPRTPAWPRLLGAVALSGVLFAAPAPAEALPPTYQSSLDEYWGAAGKMFMGATAYEVEDKRWRDGVCSYEFDEGVFIPVYSGRAPVNERLVGVIFVGEGRLRLDFPERADAWRFANHMVMQAGGEVQDYRAIAHAGAPYEVAIDRGLILTADPKVKKLVTGLTPTRSGIAYREGQDGIDEEFVVIESGGKLGARIVATNLLPNRRELLVKAGLDPSAMMRQDRLLHEEFGLAGRHLRSISDFHTAEAYKIAAQTGKGLEAGGYDEWMTCFRDGLDQAETGYRAMAFSHGIDRENNRRWERFSGVPYADPDEGIFEGPPVRMDAVSGDVTVTAQPARGGKIQRVEVKSTITLEAVGGNLQYAMLSLPVAGAINNTWELDRLGLADGRDVAAAALRADLSWGKVQVALGTQGLDTDVDSSTGSDPALAGGIGQDGQTVTAAGGTETLTGFQSQGDQFRASFEDDSVYDREGYTETEQRQEILVVLPEPVPEGEQVTLRLDWHADWPFANYSQMNQVLGTTTGIQPVLPELLPAQGGTVWEDFTIRVGVPGVGLRQVSVAISGDTSREWVDDNLWPWTEAKGEHARTPAVSLGRWQQVFDPPQMGLPGVRVHLFNTTASYLEQFPPEARRVVSYLQRFLPFYPQNEVEIFQGASTFTSTALRRGLRSSAYGMVGIQTIRNSEVGETTALEKQNQYLAQTQIARQITGQIWGQLVTPATARDVWIPDALSDAYAAYYVRSAFGNEAYEERMFAVRDYIEEVDDRAGQEAKAEAVRFRRFLSLTGSTDLSDVPQRLLKEYGFYVLGDMIRLRIGDQPYFFALDRLAADKKEQHLTTEELQQAFEASSGQDLSEFFDYWVHGGYLPEVTVEYRKEDQPVEIIEGEGEEARVTGTVVKTRVHGCIVSDIPFGSFEIPIQIDDKGGERSVSALVDVDDGRGHFVVPEREGEIEVVADPLSLILAYKRKVKETPKGTTCDQEGVPRFSYGKADVRETFEEYDREKQLRLHGLEAQDAERGVDEALDKADEDEGGSGSGSGKEP